MMKRTFLVSMLCLGLGSYHSYSVAATVGSNAISSRQAKAFFPASHTNNTLSGFSVFENGLIFENHTTTCTFDAFFPLAGTIALNKGTLSLQRDLVFKSPLRLGPGTVVGNGYSIEFPRNISELTIPMSGHQKLLEEIDTHDVGSPIYGIDWSFDNQYVAVGCVTQGGAHRELQIYAFDGQTLTLTSSYDADSGQMNAVRWHPSEYYLAAGQRNEDELLIFSFDPVNGTITQVDRATVGQVHALAWHPSGTSLAVGLQSSTHIRVYPVSAGILDVSYMSAAYDVSITDTNVLMSRSVSRNALEWDPSGEYLAVGLTNMTNYKEIKIFYYDGVNLSLNAEKELGSTAYSVSWHPSSPLLVCGKSGGNNRIVLYEHDAGNGTLTEKKQAGENKAVYAVHWSVDGQRLITGSQAGTEHMEVRVFRYDDADDSVELVSGYEASTHVRAVRWSPSGNYAVSGDDLNKLVVFALKEEQLIFQDTKLFFGSDVSFTGPLHFKGTCVVNGSGHILDLSGTSSFVVHSGATLILEDAMVRGIHDDKIKCLDNTGIIILRDMHWLQDGDVTFTRGSMQWKNEVTMGGDAKFTYNSDQTSLVQSKSQLLLDIGFTFSYDPASTAQDLIDFVDVTSEIIMNGATLHATATGLTLRKGSMQVRRDSFISSEKKLIAQDTYIDYGITVGNRASTLYDFKVELLSGSALSLLQGSFVYKNKSANSLSMESDRSLLYIGENTSLQLYEEMNLNAGAITFGDNTQLARIDGKKIIGTVNTRGYLAFTAISGS